MALDFTGQTIGRYTIGQRLGRGNLGVVHQATDRDGNTYAIKILPETAVENPHSLTRFYREAQTAARLHHPHIVPVYDFGTESDLHYVVMKYLCGGTLDDWLTRHHKHGNPPLGINQLADMMRKLADALDYAHSQGVIHRDIKPSNIMFDEHGDLYLVDFSIARYQLETNRITLNGWVGTPSFMPPEQWYGNNPVPSTDQYALAVMVFLLAAGKPPFTAESSPALMHSHLHDAPPKLSGFRADLPPAIDGIMARALAKNPHDRYPTATAFITAFADAVKGLSAAEQPTEFTPYQPQGSSSERPLNNLPASRPQNKENKANATKEYTKSARKWYFHWLL